MRRTEIDKGQGPQLAAPRNALGFLYVDRPGANVANSEHLLQPVMRAYRFNHFWEGLGGDLRFDTYARAYVLIPPSPPNPSHQR